MLTSYRIATTTLARKLAVAAASLCLGGGVALAALPVTPVGATAWTVTLSASNTAPPAGTSVTLTATANQDVGPTPYFIEIYDLGNNGALVNDACGTGTTCQVSVSNQVPTCDTYQAYVADYSSTAPPSGIQATSSPVTVCWQVPQPAWSVSLVAAPSTTLSGTPATLTAVTDNNVGPTPYYIQIFDLNTSQQVTSCGTGVTCTAPVTNPSGCHAYIAVVAPYSYAYPAAGAVATSSTESVCWDLLSGGA